MGDKKIDYIVIDINMDKTEQIQKPDKPDQPERKFHYNSPDCCDFGPDHQKYMDEFIRNMMNCEF